ncbi:alpha/beta fold hydrolase [Roseitranquillus sediminis]|uniref:alpha/beta fold hydrolase n=1 Tax=Roseitranquillus sediminis TaxID=2809051 RepID=UPI001D0C8398|nr:alpha/beta fold hydrolase [Roseitranquillus sediminis]MBM9595437.1 alpha/beta fold hydrolase [Roseitranquillus sediminis]
MARLQRDGCRLYYEIHGREGPALVFAHGRGGCAASWFNQVPVFAADHRVVVFDHRGFARSTCAEDGPHLRFFVDDLEALLDAEGIERAVLVGQSMGGRTCLGFTARHPERVRGLVLSSTPGGLMIPAVLETQEARRKIPRGVEAPTAALAPAFREGRPDLTFLYEQLRALTEPPGPLFRKSLETLEGGTTPETLAGYGTPTLILSGEEDVLYPPAILEAVRDAIPGARLHRMPGVGHSPYWETPEAFNAVLKEFLTTLRD